MQDKRLKSYSVPAPCMARPCKRSPMVPISRGFKGHFNERRRGLGRYSHPERYLRWRLTKTARPRLLFVGSSCLLRSSGLNHCWAKARRLIDVPAALVDAPVAARPGRRNP
jgi:hypothetical protein